MKCFEILLKHFMCTVYQAFHGEYMKNISSRSYFYECLKNISSQSYRLINVFIKNVCLEYVYKTVFKHYRVKMFNWKRLENHKRGFKYFLKTICKRLNHFKTFLMFTGLELGGTSLLWKININKFRFCNPISM